MGSDWELELLSLPFASTLPFAQNNPFHVATWLSSHAVRSLLRSPLLYGALTTGCSYRLHSQSPPNSPFSILFIPDFPEQCPEHSSTQ